MASRRPVNAPRAHWLLLAVVLALLMAALLLAGISTGQVGEGAQTPESRAASGSVPTAFLEGGPIVDADRPDQAGLVVPEREVVLTFDDGPTPYTEEILDLLRARGVPATFFLVGARAADRPDLVGRMHAEGHEVGVHTFTHANIANVSPWRQQVELDQSQLAIAAATGHTTSLLRPPYSSQVGNVSYAEWQAIERARGYRVVYTDLDTRDWDDTTPDRIAAAAMPVGNRGAVVMLHDGGGDRSRTVAALDRMIDQLQQRGYRFVTVSEAAGLSTPWHQATRTQIWQGAVICGVVGTATATVSALKVAFILLALLAVLRTVLLLALARRHDVQPPLGPAPAAEWPAVSVIVPAFNEEVGIAAAVRSLAASRYRGLEIIVVDDGSTDRTAEIVEGLGLPGVRLIRQPNGGKPSALNSGIGAARHDVLVLVDGDTVFEPDSVSELVRPLLAPGGDQIGAVSGNTKVGNRRGLLGRWQHIEYVIGFNLDRRMYDVLQCMPTVPGAIGAFRRQALVDVGGLSDDTLAEDTDLTMAVCRAGWRVVYAPQARAWTEAPATLGQLWRQRYRWGYGTLQAMWKHRHAAVEHGAAGKLGRRGLPYLLAFQVVLPLLAPVIDIATLYALFVSWTPELLYVTLGFGLLQLIAAGYAFRLDGESPRPLWSLPLQQVVYRQLMYLVVLQSVASAVYGVRQRWRVMRRVGLDSAPLAALADAAVSDRR